MDRSAHLQGQVLRIDIPPFFAILLPCHALFASNTPALFVDKLVDHLKKKWAAVIKAVEQHGYRVREIAAHLELHDSSVSRIARGKR